MPSNEKIEGEFHYAEYDKEQDRWEIVRRAEFYGFVVGYESDAEIAHQRANQLDTTARHFIELGKQQREKPTGTIFELDLFCREGLERMAKTHESSSLRPGTESAAAIRQIAADLKPLIDNLMAQYCPDGQAPTDDHREQVRHWLRVAANSPEPCRLEALLHDVVEDGYATLDEIGEWFGPDAFLVVHLHTRRDGETYADYIERTSSITPSAQIKIADLKDNLARMDEAHEHNREKYEKALAVLETSTEREGADG